MKQPNLTLVLKHTRIILVLSVLSMFASKQSHAQGGTSMNDAIHAGYFSSTDGTPFSEGRSSYYYSDNYYWGTGQPSPDVWYYIQVDDYASLQFSLCGSNFNTYLHLLDEYGNEITSNDDSYECGGTSSFIEYYNLPSGNYYVVVEGSSYDSGDYYFTIQPLFGGQCNSSPSPGANMSNAIAAGNFSASGSYTDSRSNADACLGNDIGQTSNDIYYQFSLSNTATVNLSHCGSGFDTYMWLLDASGNEITHNDDNYSSPCPGLESYIQTSLSAGTYYLVSEAYGGGSGTINTNITVSMTGGGGSSNCTGSPLNTALSQDQNYILENTIKIAGITNTSQLVGRKSCEVNQTVKYFDGLGRPMQVVQVMGSPLEKDIVQPIAYDEYGREKFKYLPYASSSNNGSYKTDALNSGAGVFNFYNPSGSSGSQLSGGIPRIPTPFAETKFEASPLNRVEQLGAPGDAWQLTNGHTQKQFYETNVASEVSRWDISGTGAYINGSYTAGTLYKTRSQDENGHETIEYKDLEGRVILKKAQDSPSSYTSTYYIYDDQGNLRFVVPPKVTVSSFDENTTEFTTLMYGYRYDQRNRLVKKKIPGKGWESMVYNKLDQVVATQDALQAATNLYTFTKYDGLGRVIMTGEVTEGRSPQTLQNDLQNQGTNWETPNNGFNDGYTQSSFPTSWNKLFTVNYYDNYNYPGYQYGYTATDITTRTTGLLTGSKVRNLETGAMLLTENYYDEDARLRESIVQNHVGGADRTINDYSFAGELTQSTRTHSSAAVSSLVITNQYKYDHVGRKKQSWQQTGTSGANVMLSQLDYNEVGQLYQKKLHSEDGTSFIEPITYTYNPRGWLAGISSSKLTEQLYYEDAQLSGSTPNYNGNITEAWYSTPNRGDRRFYYKYDEANRLKESKYHAGIAHTGELDEVITYDKMGNIENLVRGNSGLSFTHSGTFAYDYTGTGNRLNWVKNNNNTYRSYTYDNNGNVTADGALGFEYNELNLPKYIKQNNTPVITYTYTATGQKLKKSSGQTGVTDYVNGIQYINNGSTIDFIQTEEGRYDYSSGKYQYNLKDHLGNVRVMIDKSTATTSTAVQETEYYAFGLNVNRTSISPDNKYLYNGKEMQDDYGLNQYDYHARFYDPVIGRFTKIDPHAENYYPYSPYVYVGNNPLRRTDPTGKDWLDEIKKAAKNAAAAVARNVTDAAVKVVANTVESTKTSIVKTVSDTKKSISNSTTNALKSGQAYIKENKTAIVKFAQNMQKVGDGVAVTGGVVAVGSALTGPGAAVGVPAGTIVAGAGALYSGIGSGVEFLTEAVTLDVGNAAGVGGKALAGQVAGMAADKIVDAVLPGPNPRLPAGAKDALKQGVNTTLTVIDNMGD